MTGALGSKPKATPLPPEPAPAPTFMEAEEVKGAKKKVRKRRGRESTILAGRMMAERDSGNLRQILG